MSFMGAVGVVAQQGNQVSGGIGPSNVSVATSSTGNYDNAALVFSSEDDGLGNDWIDEDGSNFSSHEVDITVIRGVYQAVLANTGGEVRMMFGTYLRATGATSYSTGLHSLEINIAGGNYGNIAINSGTADTSQDNISGMDQRIDLAHGSGGRGYVMPDGDENLNVSITGTATDGNGVSTAGTPLLITVTWD
jgi:hypothetical protein